MKFVKGFSLFFLYPVLMFCIGFFGGIACMDYFYPGRTGTPAEDISQTGLPAQDQSLKLAGDRELSPAQTVENGIQQGILQDLSDGADQGALIDDGQEQPEAEQAAASSETLNVDTEYVLEETDMRKHTVVETTWRLPPMYVGMNREQFLEAMEEYEARPPLSEMERGFVSLEVLSFSRERVVVQMNYQYIQPSDSFYLMVEDNYVVVYLDDRDTVYMNTDIKLDSLPEEVQQEIIQVMFMPDEESLYDFLETYSS